MDSVVVEIRPAEGGDDAKLFTHDLFKVMVAYCERMRWEVELVDIRPAKIGFHEIVFIVRGAGAARGLEPEAGGHRIQRVPPTEKRGRRQTSTVTVAVLPEPTEAQVHVDPKDLRWEMLKASSKGGQHANKNESGVRVTHAPTGVVAVALSKSQYANKKQALQVLRSRLLQRHQGSLAQTRCDKRSEQVGSGMRGDKVRTIRYQDGQVTDHRTGKKIHIRAWESGGWRTFTNPFVKALTEQEYPMLYYTCVNPDGFLFCPKNDKVMNAALLDCFSCPYFAGSLQGAGRECIIGDEGGEVEIRDPYEYADRKKNVSLGS